MPKNTLKNRIIGSNNCLENIFLKFRMNDLSGARPLAVQRPWIRNHRDRGRWRFQEITNSTRLIVAKRRVISAGSRETTNFIAGSVPISVSVWSWLELRHFKNNSWCMLHPRDTNTARSCSRVQSLNPCRSSVSLVPAITSNGGRLIAGIQNLTRNLVRRRTMIERDSRFGGGV